MVRGQFCRKLFLSERISGDNQSGTNVIWGQPGVIQRIILLSSSYRDPQIEQKMETRGKSNGQQVIIRETVFFAPEKHF